MQLVGPVYDNPICRTGRPTYIAWQNRFLGSLNVCKFGPKYTSSYLLVKCCPTFLILVSDPPVLLSSINYKYFGFFSSAFKVWSSRPQNPWVFGLSYFCESWYFLPYMLTSLVLSPSEFLNLCTVLLVLSSSCPLILWIFCCPVLFWNLYKWTFPTLTHKKRIISGCEYFFAICVSTL